MSTSPAHTAHDELKAFVQTFIQPTEEEWLRFYSIVDYSEVSAKQHLVRAGRRCETIYFLLDGLVKYLLFEQGEPKVIQLAGRGKIVSGFFSYYSGLPAIADVCTVTDCQLYAVKKQELEALYAASQTWEHFGRRVAENAIVQQIMERISIQTLSAEERYLKILRENPDLLLYAKLGDIAQSLGISQETLSRIRKRIR